MAGFRAVALWLVVVAVGACGPQTSTNSTRQETPTRDLALTPTLQMTLSLQSALAPPSSMSREAARSEEDGRDDYGSYRYVETFEASGQTVYAYAYDEPDDTFTRLHAFWFETPDRLVVIAHNAYAPVTEVAQGKGNIGPGETVHHVDLIELREPAENDDGTTSAMQSSTTLAAAVGRLDYEQVKRVVTAYLRDHST